MFGKQRTLVELYLSRRWRSEGRLWLAQSQSVRDGAIHNLDKLQPPQSHCTYPCSYAIAAGGSLKKDLARLSTSVACRRNRQRVDAASCGALDVVGCSWYRARFAPRCASESVRSYMSGRARWAVLGGLVCGGFARLLLSYLGIQVDDQIANQGRVAAGAARRGMLGGRVPETRLRASGVR